VLSVGTPAPIPGHLAVVTGATSGIGWSLARQLAGAGHDLLLVARSEDELRDRAAELRGSRPVSVEYEARDLADTGALAAFCDRLTTLPVSVLCANA
jgi:short-subunit dehydrogenase